MQTTSEDTEKHLGHLIVFLLRCLHYLGSFAIFFLLMSIENWPLRHLSRTLATTLLTWWSMTAAMHAIYGGYDVGRKKNRPIISGLSLSCVMTDLVTYLQLQIMNTNSNANEHLELFGTDFLWLLLSIMLQILLISLLVRVGNRAYFYYHKPSASLLIANHAEQLERALQKVSRFRLQWRIAETASAEDSELEERINRAETVFLVGLTQDVQTRLLRQCYQKGKNVICKAQLHDIVLARSEILVIDDAPFLEMDGVKITPEQRIIKRCADILLSSLVLVLLSPLIGLIALAVHFSDGGSVFFRQRRLTMDGRTFEILKFRTMSASEEEAHSATAEDSRVTRLGRILRRTRLDELPQLWNIVKGDMSLVGPRPEMLENIRRYKSELPTFAYREKMKAGLTGYAQIEGRYNTSPEDKLMLDMLYIEGFSLWLDIQLLFRTLTVLFKPDSTEGFASEN